DRSEPLKISIAEARGGRAHSKRRAAAFDRPVVLRSVAMSLPPSLHQEPCSPPTRLPSIPAATVAPSSEANTRNVPCSPVSFAPNHEALNIAPPCSPAIFSPNGEALNAVPPCSPVLFSPSG